MSRLPGKDNQPAQKGASLFDFVACPTADVIRSDAPAQTPGVQHAGVSTRRHISWAFIPPTLVRVCRCLVWLDSEKECRSTVGCLVIGFGNRASSHVFAGGSTGSDYGAVACESREVAHSKQIAFVLLRPPRIMGPQMTTCFLLRSERDLLARACHLAISEEWSATS